MIENRNVLFITLKEPFIEWISSTNPSLKVSEDEIIKHKSIYLTKELDTRTHKSIQNLIKKSYKEIFANELWSWNTNESEWPELDYPTFNKWIEVEYLEICFDLLSSRVSKMDLFE